MDFGFFEGVASEIYTNVHMLMHILRSKCYVFVTLAS